jgi:hypothetical protein
MSPEKQVDANPKGKGMGINRVTWFGFWEPTWQAKPEPCGIVDESCPSPESAQMGKRRKRGFLNYDASRMCFFHCSVEVEGISQVGGQDGKERHSGSTRLVRKHGKMLQNVVDGASMSHRERYRC